MQNIRIEPWLNRQRGFSWIIVSQLKLPMDFQVAERIREIFFPEGEESIVPVVNAETKAKLSKFLLSFYGVKPGHEAGVLALHRKFLDGGVFSEVRIAGEFPNLQLFVSPLVSRASSLIMGRHATISYFPLQKQWGMNKYDEITKMLMLGSVQELIWGATDRWKATKELVFKFSETGDEKRAVFFDHVLDALEEAAKFVSQVAVSIPPFVRNEANARRILLSEVHPYKDGFMEHRQQFATGMVETLLSKSDEIWIVSGPFLVVEN